MKTIIQREFPILKQYTYLNTPASGVLPKSVLEFRQQHDIAFFESASKLKEKQADLLAETRQAVAQLFNCPATQTALTPNFSLGFNILLDGLPKSSTFLLLKEDYPSINWPVEQRFSDIYYSDITADMESQIAAIFETRHIDVFAFSVIQYISGIKIDLNFIKELKARYPKTMFIADGTQFCGTTYFDFETSGLDVLGASCYKWMNAGYGSAFFMFKEEVASYIHPQTKGFNFKFGKHKQQDNSLIGVFEPGHLDTLNFGSLLEAIHIINTIDVSAIQHKIERLSHQVKEALSDKGLLSDAVINRSIHSSIFNIQGNQALFEHLLEHKVLCVQRGSGIRVGFNYFNDEGDLQQLIDLL